jgi:hypothetical protein
LLSTQSTHVAVTGSHWFSVASPQPALVAGSQAVQRPSRAPAVAQTVFAVSAAHRAVAEAARSQATHRLPSQSGAVALEQSASFLHSTQAPGEPMQKRSVPVPAHAAFEPHRHVRTAHVFATSALHAPELHAVHSPGDVRTHAATPTPSQQSWLLLQAREPFGSQAPHCPFCAPLRMHTGCPPGFSAQRRSVTRATTDAVSQATQALFTQSGAIGFAVQSASTAHTTHRPV